MEVPIARAEGLMWLLQGECGNMEQRKKKGKMTGASVFGNTPTSTSESKSVLQSRLIGA